MSKNAILLYVIGLVLFCCRITAADDTYFSVTYYEEQDIYVYAPASIKSGKEYPVLYLIHGQGQEPYIWEEIGLSETLSELYESDEIIPCFIVLLHDAAYLEDMYESNFYDDFVTRVMPFVDENFPVSKDPNLTAIGGISRGAQWTQYIAFGEYGRFKHIGIHSPANPFFSLPKIYRIICDHPDVPNLRIRIDIGNADIYIISGSEVSSQLLKLYYPHEFVLGVGGHDTDYWSDNLAVYLKWYAEGFRAYL
ncbi:MAG: hypothetical protein IJI41_09220 [Anaerolineaceae bacterium]|nr:hypothetical protein [Anaerolineaceae bacterium]